MQKIGKFDLKNKGGFVVRLEFEYYNESSSKWIRTGGTGDITLGFSKQASPGDHGVPDGSMVRLHANVIWGTDRVSNEMFLYEKGNGSVVCYAISGTTLNNHLDYLGVKANLEAAGEAGAAEMVNPADIFDFSNLSDKEMEEVKADLEGAPFAQSGTYGPLSWDVCFNLDTQDITKSSVDVKIAVLSFNIIDAHLDAQNPKAAANLSVAGIGVVAELGVDFNKRIVYLKGKLDFVLYKKEFNINIFSF